MASSYAGRSRSVTRFSVRGSPATRESMGAWVSSTSVRDMAVGTGYAHIENLVPVSYVMPGCRGPIEPGNDHASGLVCG